MWTIKNSQISLQCHFNKMIKRPLLSLKLQIAHLFRVLWHLRNSRLYIHCETVYLLGALHHQKCFHYLINHLLTILRYLFLIFITFCLQECISFIVDLLMFHQILNTEYWIRHGTIILNGSIIDLLLLITSKNHGCWSFSKYVSVIGGNFKYSSMQNW